MWLRVSQIGTGLFQKHQLALEKQEPAKVSYQESFNLWSCSFYLIWFSINCSVPCWHILHYLLLAWQTLQSRSTLSLSLSFCSSLSSFFQLSNFYFLHLIFFSLSLLVCWLESLNNYSNILFFSLLPSMSDTLVLPSTWFSPKSARHCELSHGFEAKTGC